MIKEAFEDYNLLKKAWAIADAVLFCLLITICVVLQENLFYDLGPAKA